jgi:hypothetical protein
MAAAGGGTSRQLLAALLWMKRGEIEHTLKEKGDKPRTTGCSTSCIGDGVSGQPHLLEEAVYREIGRGSRIRYVQGIFAPARAQVPVPVSSSRPGHGSAA